MKTPTSKELAAVAHVCTIAAAEQNRADWWQVIDIRDRQHALDVARLSKDRATDPIAAFSDDERARIRMAISVHVSRMTFVAKCFEASNTNVNGYLH
jgi:hypothetical protein